MSAERVAECSWPTTKVHGPAVYLVHTPRRRIQWGYGVDDVLLERAEMTQHIMTQHLGTTVRHIWLYMYISPATQWHWHVIQASLLHLECWNCCQTLRPYVSLLYVSPTAQHRRVRMNSTIPLQSRNYPVSAPSSSSSSSSSSVTVEWLGKIPWQQGAWRLGQ